MADSVIPIEFGPRELAPKNRPGAVSHSLVMRSMTGRAYSAASAQVTRSLRADCISAWITYLKSLSAIPFRVGLIVNRLTPAIHGDD